MSTSVCFVIYSMTVNKSWQWFTQWRVKIRWTNLFCFFFYCNFLFRTFCLSSSELNSRYFRLIFSYPMFCHQPLRMETNETNTLTFRDQEFERRLSDWSSAVSGKFSSTLAKLYYPIKLQRPRITLSHWRTSKFRPYLRDLACLLRNDTTSLISRVWTWLLKSYSIRYGSTVPDTFQQ